MTQKPGLPPDYMRNMALATVAGQAGCTTVVLVFAALFGGMFIDSRLNTHPVFTIGLVLVSVPISLYAMIRLLLSAVAAMRHPPQATDSGADAPSDPAARSSRKENGS